MPTTLPAPSAIPSEMDETNYDTKGKISVTKMKAGIMIGVLCLIGVLAAYYAYTRTSADAMVSYLEAKRKFAEKFAEGLGIKQTDKYRLVAVIGPQWKVGDALDPENLLSEITDKCVVPSDQLPELVPWSGLPEYASDRTVDFSAGVPAEVAKAFKSPIVAALHIKWQQGGRFLLKDLSQVVLPENSFLDAVGREVCGNGLKGKSALFVRGVISGKEVFGSARTLSDGGNVQVKDVELLKLKYEDSEKYELEDRDRAPKFFVITLVKGAPPGAVRGPIEYSAPSEATIQALEALNLTKGN
jgi:hypothetical protein